ncbi:hypothetical protein E2562_035897 [Oryza meyeriana var. granulata]|uniref:DUF1618 domain-containing protein n=1 Tax=Oryza meyeriana var. granulata TaxID=110450 RepID=A0A6G1E752_9ORYZ|nr:hypothetical protein E2562_035897 [Oryza meyeriana var. granulata]
MSEAPREKVDAGVEDRHWKTKDGGKWVVMACVLHVVRGDYFEPGIDIVIKDAIPPRATRLVVHRSIAPSRKTIDDHPYVAGADCHGRLLLYASQGPEPEPPVLDAFDTRPLSVHHGFPKAYFICDTRTHKSTRLFDHGFPIIHPGNAGLVGITKDIFVVADLHPTATVGADKAALLVYFSVSEIWRKHEVDYPPRDRPWGGNGVVVYGTIIWWVDLSYGLLACDLRTTRHVLRFVPLPPGCELPPGTADLDKCRCVVFRGVDLRYVQIHERTRDGEPTVSMWTLVDPRAGTWRLDCEVLVKYIWDDEGYKATKLPREVPTVALIHPEHAGDVAYFFLHSRLFGVDLRACKVLEWQFFAMLNPPMAYHSSRFVRAWAPQISGSDDQKKDVPPVSKSNSTKSHPSKNPRLRDPRRRQKRPVTSS